MKRRNFVIGLGTVAVASGAVSVTAASFTESMSATADFRVIAARDLELRRGDDVDPDEDDAYAEDELEFEDLDLEELPLAYVDDPDEDESTNDELDINLAVANEEQDLEEEYLGILEIENSGFQDEEIGITYDYGEDVDEDGPVDEETVNGIFQFEIDDDQISPAGAENEPDETVTIEAGETETIDLIVEIDENDVDEIGEAADVSDNPFDQQEEDVDLLDQIEVGIVEAED